MYIPTWFREDDPAILHDIMRQNAFALLVTTDAAGVPFATHLPFVLDAERGERGVLRAHMARPNPGWRHFMPDREILVVFSGPHGYVSPTWYEAAPNVPTWNYAAVHAYGTPQIVADDALYALLHASLEQFEPGSSAQFAEDADRDAYVRKLMRGIVGFEITITRLEGKLKLSQNKASGDQAAVVAALERSPLASDAELAAYMRDRLPSS